MADNNLVAGDIVYPNIWHKRDLPVKAVSGGKTFKKGELVTNDADGYVTVLDAETADAGKERGIWQCLHETVAPTSGDGTVIMEVAGPGSRILAHVQADAVAGRMTILADENGAGDTSAKNLEIAASATVALKYMVGRIWELYPDGTKRKSTAGQLAVIDLVGF